MKTIVLIRHAKAEHFTNNITDDFERNLSSRGKKDAKIMGKRLKENIKDIKLFISSSAIRTTQTSRIISEEYNYDKDKIKYEKFIYDGYTTAQMLKYISSIDNDINKIAIIGHNPDIAQLGLRLSNSNIFHFPTCMIMGITFDSNSWSDINAGEGILEYYDYPNKL